MLHERWPAADERTCRRARICHVTAPALVIGSTQRHIRASQEPVAGLEVVRRLTGGGAVLVAPGMQTWLDLWIPRPDPLFEDDVISSAFWVGELWSYALGLLGVRGATVHKGRASTGEWPKLLCFAGLGPGEVLVGGRKLSGLAQRRDRDGAWFHSVALGRWEPAPLLALLRATQLAESAPDHPRTPDHPQTPDHPASAGTETALHGRATGLCDLTGRDPGAAVSLMEAALLAALSA